MRDGDSRDRKFTRRAVVGATAASAGGLVASAVARAASATRSTDGPARGVAVIEQGCQHRTVNPGVALAKDAQVLCTLQSHPGGRTAIQHVEVNPAENTFTVFLTGETTGDTSFAWSLLS